MKRIGKQLMLEAPQPRLNMRRFNGVDIPVWECKVGVDLVEGWPENPRIKLAAAELLDRMGGSRLSQEQLLALMTQDADVDLKPLRDDILKNGLREPIILNWNGKLLDGNRRYWAIRFALQGELQEDQRERLSAIPAFVLDESVSESQENVVLVEENFAPSLKREWPDYVKGQYIKQASDESGMSHKAIAKRYNWKTSKVRETLRTMDLIESFQDYAERDVNPEDPSLGGFGLSHGEAERLSSKSYQYFNEAQKSFYKALKEDFQWEWQFYRWIADEKFRSFKEVRHAHACWSDPGLRGVILGDRVDAADLASKLYQANQAKLQVQSSVEDQLLETCNFLEGLSLKETEGLTDHLSRVKSALERVLKFISS